MVEKFSIRLVDEFERKFGHGAAWKRACDLMIAYFSELKLEFPELATRGLEAATRYREGKVGVDHLVAVRDAGWNFLKEQKALAAQRTPEQHLIRAVALLLSERDGPGEPNDNSSEVILSLWDVAHRFDTEPNRITGYIERYFSSSPNGQSGN